MTARGAVESSSPNPEDGGLIHIPMCEWKKGGKHLQHAVQNQTNIKPTFGAAWRDIYVESHY